MSRANRMLAASAGVACVVTMATVARAYCPCYTASSSYNDHQCAIEAVQGTNPSLGQWSDIFDLVAKGPSAWGNAGPAVADIGQGCGQPEPLHDVPARFPCELLKAIAMVESGWTQFCVPQSPADQVGGPSRTIISFDCGYGVGQVTSGMHTGETPEFDRERVAADATYNLATGTRILASKWRATECVGDNQPSIIEDWYIATWAYNGLAYVNNPNNPDLDPNRGVYDPKVGGAYAYQEKVFGRIENPPSAEHWSSVALAYPQRSQCGGSGVPPALSEPDCASPTDCNNHRPTHVSSCLQGEGGQGGSPGQGGSAGQPGEGGSAGSTSWGGAAGSGGNSGLDAALDQPSSDAAQGGFAGGPDATADAAMRSWGAQQDEGSCACRAPAGRARSGGWWLLVAAAWAHRLRNLFRRRGEVTTLHP